MLRIAMMALTIGVTKLFSKGQLGLCKLACQGVSSGVADGKSRQSGMLAHAFQALGRSELFHAEMLLELICTR